MASARSQSNSGSSIICVSTNYMRGVIEPHQPPPRLSDTPLGEGGRAGIEAGASSGSRDVKQDQHGGHDKSGVGYGDHRLPGKAPGEPLKGSTHPLNELQPAFSSRGKRAGWGGGQVKHSIRSTVGFPREAIGLTWVQLAEVTVLLDGANRQCPGKHLGRLHCTQHRTTQQRPAIAHFASNPEPVRQQLYLLEATFCQATTTHSPCDDIAQSMIGFPMTDQDESYLAERSLPVCCSSMW